MHDWICVTRNWDPFERSTYMLVAMFHSREAAADSLPRLPPINSTLLEVRARP
jgi:hypothetical protein